MTVMTAMMMTVMTGEEVITTEAVIIAEAVMMMTITSSIQYGDMVLYLWS